MSATKPPAILFDVGHNEELTLVEPELAFLAQLLEANGFALSTDTTSLSSDELSQYQVVVVGNPFKSKLNSDEISALRSYVEVGRGLLLVSGATIFGKGGDIARSTNLNDLARLFGFEFSNKSLEPPPEGEGDFFHAVPAGNHPVLAGVGSLILSSGTTLVAEDADTHLFRVSSSLGAPTIAIATSFKKGRVAAFGGGTFFFNDYIAAGDHEKFIVQLFRWLAGEPIDLPVQKVTKASAIMDEVTATEAIEELREQLDKIEDELSSLKEVIHSSIKEMEKMVRELQDKDKET
ncbi:MAG: hypothetical protein ACFFCH_00635 [Promethearchaeota archaeon]